MPINLKWWEIFIKFGKTGAFIFLGLYVLITVFPHVFSDTRQNDNKKEIVKWAYVGTMIILIGVSSSFFMSFLEITGLLPFNLFNSTIATVGGMICAIIFKAYFLLDKKETKNTPDNSFETKLAS